MQVYIEKAGKSGKIGSRIKMSMINDFDSDLLLKAYDVWSDLQRLAQDSLGEEDITYPERDRKLTSNSPTIEEIRVILFAFRNEGAIKKINGLSFDRSNKPYQWNIKIDFHYFKELEGKLKNLFLAKTQEKLEKEGISLGGVFDFTKQPKLHKGQMFETGSGGGYYNRNYPIRPQKKQTAHEIVNGFSPSNYDFVLMVSEGILSASEFGSNGEANYQLQSRPGQMLMQERQLLTKFESLGLFRNLGEDGIFAIAKLRDVDTEAIKQIIAEIKIRQNNINPFTANQLEHQQETSFIDTATRRGIERKWDVLQAIWSVYESNSRPDSILVPVARLTIKGRDVVLIDGIIEGLKKEGEFQKWDRKDRYYDLEFINHELLPKIYQEVGDTYKKLASEHEKQQKTSAPSGSKKLSKRELRKKVNIIIKATKLGKKEKALLKFLAKDFDPKTIREIVEEIESKAPTKLMSKAREKINGTEFGIKTNKSSFSRDTTYELEYLPAQESA